MQERDLDIREKKSAIIDFISAGIETVSSMTESIEILNKNEIQLQLANTLSFMLYYTTKDPNVQIKIRNEIANCDNDFSKAYFTKACIQEVFRLTPTAFCLARLLEEDTTLCQFELKAGVCKILYVIIPQKLTAFI